MQSLSTTLFADADSTYQDASYVIFGVPFDATTTFKAGTRDALVASRARSYNVDTDLPFLGVRLAVLPVR